MSVAPEAARLASRWSAVRTWLTHGSRHGSRGYASYGPRRATVWGIPKRVWRVYRHRQMIQLTPIVYVVVVGGGLVIGFVLALVLGLWWWMPPAALLVALWVFEGSSDVWSGRWGKHPYTLRTELLAAFAPQSGSVARQAEDRAKLLDSGLPLFAPVDWSGRLVFGGWGGSGRQLSTISIVCVPPGQEHPDGDDLTVTTDADTRDESSLRRHLVRLGELEPVWHPISMRADGQDLAGWGFELEGRHCRYARIGAYWVTTTGGLDTIGLPISRVDASLVGAP